MTSRLVVCLMLGPAAGLAADCIRVNGDRILARHLAPAGTGIEAIPQDTFIGFSPKPGVARWLAPELIEAAGARFGVKLNVPAAVCVERQSSVLEAAAIRRAMEASLTQAGYTRFNLEVASYPEHPLPDGVLEFSLAGLVGAPDKSGEMVWRGRLRVAGHQSIPVRARVNVSVETEQLRATRAIRAGETLSAENVAMAVWRRAPATMSTSMKLSEAEGMQARRRIDAGQAVLRGMLASPPDIRKGDAVLVTAAVGGATLGVHARAETTAHKGEQVVLTNPTSGKKFRAKATGRGQAAVDLESSSNETNSTDGPSLPTGGDAGAVQAGRQETAGGVGTGPDHR